MNFLAWLAEGLIVPLPHTFSCGGCGRTYRRVTRWMADQVGRTGGFTCRRCATTVLVRGRT